MKMKRILMTVAVVTATLALASCGKTIDLEGYAWTATVNGTDDEGDAVTMKVAMLCTSKEAGTLFVGSSYDDDPMDLGEALPFTYKWDDNEGTLTATYSYFELYKGTQTVSLPMSYSKTTGLVVDWGALYRLGGIPLNPAGLTLEKKEIYKAASLKGTEWALAYDENPRSESLAKDGVRHYSYTLAFTTASTAKLTLCITEGDEESETYEWSIAYSYADGVGKMTVKDLTWGDTFTGYFYLPDEKTITFCDGGNILPMKRV